jgi:hypothetical protein
MDLKKWWAKLNKREQVKPINKGPQPAAVWMVIVTIFYAGLAVVTVAVFLLQARIDGALERLNLDTGEAAVKLDQKKLGVILADHERRAADLSALKAQQPSVVDPGM